jgi:hypothetical protein
MRGLVLSFQRATTPLMDGFAHCTQHIQSQCLQLTYPRRRWLGGENESGRVCVRLESGGAAAVAFPIS